MEHPNEILNCRFLIDEILVDPQANTIRIRRKTTPIEPQVMHVLLCLAGHPGEVLTREYIINQVWNDSIPNDEGLSQAIWKLRAALGDSSKESRLIQTVRKRGYRLNVPVRKLDEHQKAPSSARLLLTESLSPSYRKGALVLACSALIMLLYWPGNPQKNLQPIEEREWSLVNDTDTLIVKSKMLSTMPTATLPEGLADSLVVEALNDFASQQALVDSLQLDRKIQKFSIRHTLPLPEILE